MLGRSINPTRRGPAASPLAGILLATGVLAPAAGMLVLASCSSPPPRAGPPVDERLDQTKSAAAASYRRDLTPQALELYRAALLRARAIDDQREIESAAYNLAVCALELDRLDDAAAAIAEANAAVARGRRPAPADLRLIEAEWQLRAAARGSAAPTAAPPIPGAVALTRALVADPTLSPDERALALAIQGEALASVDGSGSSAALAEARVALQQFDATLPRVTDLGTRARGESLRAVLAERAEPPAGPNWPSAAAARDRQASLLREAGVFRAMAAALEHAGEAHARTHAPDSGLTAADRFERAARSFQGLGVKDRALAAARRAAEHARAAGDQAAQSRLAALVLELAPPAPPPSSLRTIEGGAAPGATP